ncbi:MAG: HAD hydrolase-like protein [Comamonas sp.]
MTDTSHDLLLFDLDGTLSDPALGIGRSIEYALQCHGYPPLPPSQLPAWIGPPLDVGFRTLAGAVSDADVRALVASYRERYAALGYAENVLYPGVAEALARLTADGWPLAVCTSKRADFAERILAHFGLRQHFRFVDGGDIGIHKTQQIAQLRAQGLVSTASVMIGDRDVDIVAAHRNGLAACGVLWGYGGREELSALQPRYLLACPTTLASPSTWPGFPQAPSHPDSFPQIQQ